MKILFCIKSIDGGTGTFLLDLLKIKDLFKDYNPIFKTLVLETPNFRKVAKPQDEISFLRKRLFYPEKYNLSFKNILNFLEEPWWFNKEIKNFQPDLVFTIDVHCSILLMLLKLLGRYNFKTIITTHVDLETTLKEKTTPFLTTLIRMMVQKFYNRANLLIFVSRGLAKNFRHYFNVNNKYCVIYNSIHFDNSKLKPSNNRANKKIIASVGRLVEQKDYCTLLKAFQFLSRDFSDVELWIAGDGAEKDELARMVRDLDIATKVKFLGWKSNVFKFLTNADIFAFSSKREGFGYVLLEAMACGKPIVSTDAPYGPSEILGRGKYGMLVPVRDVAALKKAMLKLLTNKLLYKHYAKQSAERVKFFSEDKMLKSYKKAIEQVLNQ